MSNSYKSNKKELEQQLFKLFLTHRTNDLSFLLFDHISVFIDEFTSSRFS